MSYIVKSDFRSDMPKTLKNADLFTCVIMHTTEGGTGIAGAMGTISYMISVASTRNVSYHELWVWENGIFTVIRIVPYNYASHSINPNPPPNGSYEPDAEARPLLGWDPNQHGYAVSIAGRVTNADTYSKDPAFVAYGQQRLKELATQFKRTIPFPLVGHYQIAPSNRTDPGRILMPALEREVITTNMILLPVRQEWTTGVGNSTPGGQFYLDGPGVGTVKWFTISERVTSVGETPDFKWRLILYGNEYLWMSRSNLTPISNTRVPTTGYGLTFGSSQAELDAALARISSLENEVQTLSNQLTNLDASIKILKGLISNHVKPELDLLKAAGIP